MPLRDETFWINGDPSPGLALVLGPRGNDWLEDEMRRMKLGGIEVLVSLLEAEEAAELGLSQEGELAGAIGLQFRSFPIPDRHVPPNRARFEGFCAELAARLGRGERIGIHCRGSIGRATIAAACTLIHLSWSPESALRAIEAARGCPIPDTPEQRQWILDYKAAS